MFSGGWEHGRWGEGVQKEGKLGGGVQKEGDGGGGLLLAVRCAS